MDLVGLDSLLKLDFGEIGPGEDISESIDYMKLESLFERSEETMFEESDKSEPDWGWVNSQCYELLTKSRNIWVAVFLSYSLGKTDGIEGLTAGLKYVKNCLSELWPDLYPRLDEEDNNDPYERVNALSIISPEPGLSFGVIDFSKLVSSFKISQSKQIGSYSYQDYKDSINSSNDDAEESAGGQKTSLIEASFKDTSDEILSEKVDHFREVKNCLSEIAQIFSEKTSGEHSVDFSRLISLTDEIASFTLQFCSSREEIEENVSQDSHDFPNSINNTVSPGFSGKISSHKEALDMLREISRYFRENEPSSPVPLILQRAEELVSKDFNEIMQDICPDAIRQMDWLIRDGQA
ncbi:type VI secretion system protein TssA [Sedimentisphaera salicampi]|uniref:Type VI secretion-associated protein, ImpA family n=1 Tax=Sedimentisphaera salicampi TaxID=1941349 RepID=A0A1W6LMD2_9BACT|nr:type VI secretion system protein TssA [Sedimentisphaera salicampi]ARN56935.1 type VI secretion-associated protein, ImpA family [Sedimentisphaera salicampi]